MRKYILILISVVLLGVVILYVIKSQANTNTMHSDSTQSDTIVQQTIKPTSPTVEVHTSSKKEKPMSTAKISKDTQEETSSSHTRVLYKTLPLDEAQLSTTQKRHIKPLSAISLNTDTFTNMQKGDTLTLPDIEGLDYTLTVVDVQTYENGATSTTAKYEDEGVTYTTTITHSENETFITLATAQGIYEIEAEAGTGYVYNSSDIRKQLQRPHGNDVVILPIPKKPILKKPILK